MSRFVVLARPSLVTGFRLAGVEALAAGDAKEAQQVIERWLVAEEDILLALDDGLLERLPDDLIRRMEAARSLLYVSIPAGDELSSEVSRQQQIATMLRQAIGFSITFREEEVESE
jgi:vacuolar-type H+-ATPase subunit F/Vma7